ncbi:hypothetical protein BDQ17DRAFT_1348488 [Cyathus striatus]|nr:hypothetical protein BDQ17DRAFT_1348488 [Cyathus striatus]
MSNETATLQTSNGNAAPASSMVAIPRKNEGLNPTAPTDLAKQDKRIRRPEQKEINPLPAPPEQFFTVMAPGKVLNLDDYISKEKSIIPPRFVQLAEAILCDDMPALAPVQLGPTGRSVSRSYDATLSKLCPAGSVTGIDDDPKVKLSEQAERYKKAMAWLTGYKQNEYTKAFEEKTKENVTNEQKRIAYDNWVAENQKSYRNKCQAAYMDWVTNGKKEETEYWFSIVDNNTAMSRVEASKEAMRNLSICDEDGAVEYQKVKLTPSNWASLAKEKAFGSSTVDALKWNISRLSKINAVIKGMLAGRQIEGSTVEVVAKDTDEDLRSVHDAALSYVRALKEQLKPGSSSASKEAALNKRNQLQKALEVTAQADDATENVEKLYHAKQSDLEYQYKTNANLIADYQNQLGEIDGSNSLNALQKAICKELNISPATPLAPVTNAADYWTQIKVGITRSETGDRTVVTSTSAEAGQDNSYSDLSDSSAAGVIKELSNASVEIIFDCMRVDIHRGWLRGEIFYDHDLKPAPKNHISPGPITLATLLDSESYQPPAGENGEKLTREQFLEKYYLFPMYPTAFLLAANITLKVESQSSAIKDYFNENSSSYSRHNESINYGPFCIRSGNESNASGAAKSNVADSQCITTGNTFEIKIKSPQIIGTVSQILPTLPRPNQK